MSVRLPRLPRWIGQVEGKNAAPERIADLHDAAQQVIGTVGGDVADPQGEFAEVVEDQQRQADDLDQGLPRIRPVVGLGRQQG
ncbi:hypothetical protein [Streptomyces purpurascens]|uniref:Uncharacterized protein n=2 Tax=Streptomyces purpurascens TaxID=1924 RepID=A0ABZ1MDV3_STREF|nr:hypothetical protein [Streptomyces purpurascens]